MGKPMVSTAVGVEGLPLTNGRHLLIADQEEAFAQAVVTLLTDKELRRRLGQAARAFVTEHCSWDRAGEEFARICRRTVQV